jgi:hypothetical protein
MPGRHRQPPFGDRHIEVATRDSHRPDDRLFRSLDLGLAGVPPGVFTCRLEYQLLHARPFLSDLSNIVERSFK